MASTEDLHLEPISDDPLSAGALDALEGEVVDIERALARLDDGSYGTCEVCAQRLPVAVLNERPAARYCADHLPINLD
jgi:RNA polymerase-binding transcription factor DksA